MHMAPGPVHESMSGYVALSPGQDGSLMGSSLPPMSTFRAGPMGASQPVPVVPNNVSSSSSNPNNNNSSSSSNSNNNNGLGPGPVTASPLYGNHSASLGPANGAGQTEIRDALGKALASVSHSNHI